MTGNDDPIIQLPAEAEPVIWRIFGNGVTPFKRPTSHDLVEPIIRKQLGKTEAADRAIDEIRGWFDPNGGPNQLRQEMREPVAQLIICGIRKALSNPDRIENHDTAFWAMGSISTDVSAPIIRSSWSSDKIDRFASYVLKTLESLHQQRSIIDPKDVVGPDIAGAKAYPSEIGKTDLLRTFHVGPDAVYQAYQLMYPGIAPVVDLLLELKPEMLPELVNKVQNPLLQSFATHCVTDTDATSGYRQPLQWIADTSSNELVALAILHTMENVREMEFASRSVPSSDTAETPDLATMSDLISDLVSNLAALEPNKSTRWIFELLNYTSDGPNEKRPTAEQVEQHCTQLLKDIVLHHWSNEVVNELRSGLQRAMFEPRGKPLADIAWEIRDGQPVKAARISRILLDEHERRMAGAVKDDLQFPYLTGRWNHRDWLTALAAAVVIYHKDIDPTDWAIEKCQARPLSAWDADEGWKVFHVADQVVQTQIEVALYAVQLLTNAGRTLDSDKVLVFAGIVWDHTIFVRQHNEGLHESSGVAELTARVAVALGEPCTPWLMEQARNPGVDPRSLWVLLDQMKYQENTIIHDDILAEIRKIASHRYINAREVDPQRAPHLVNLWRLLDAPEEAARTAKFLLTYHPTYIKESNRPPHINRDFVIPVLKMLAFAESRGELQDDMIKASRSLYDNLWERYTLPDEKESRQEIDALLNQTPLEEDAAQERG